MNTYSDHEIVESMDDMHLNSLVAMSQQDGEHDLQNHIAFSIPVAELSTLGAGISSLVPAFHTVTETVSISVDGLYKIANAAPGDTLKMARNGNAWGALKTADGGSKMLQLKQAGALSANTQAVAAFNPATMMMAAALYSIEKDLSEISETQKKILSFLEAENESQIEADVDSLTNIASNYKYTWDNEVSVAGNHKLALDIQNRARKNIRLYAKQIADTISAKHMIVAQKDIDRALADLEKKFKYYRLSLFTFSLASLMGIMLSGNFEEGYIDTVKEEIETLSDAYREQFEKGSLYLERLGNAGAETAIVKRVASTGKTLGKFIGSIPVVKEGSVDEFLQEKGELLQNKANEREMKAISTFSALSNPGTRVFVNKMEDMIQIYNHTSSICVDKQNIYLIA